MNENKLNNTLSDQIKKKISFRVLVCIVLYLIFFFSISAYDFHRGMSKIGIRLKELSSELDEYIISQILVDNEQSIAEKLKATASAHHMSIHWDKLEKNVTQNITWFFPFGWNFKSNIATLDGRSYGAIIFEGSLFNDKDFIFEILFRMFFLVLFLIFMLLILYPLTLKIPKVLFLDPLLNLLALLKTPETYQAGSSSIMETYELSQIEEQMIALIEKAKNDSRNAAIGQIASQVAHDIRSPLAALNVLAGQDHQMKKDQEALLRNSINRINNIANNLLKNNEEQLLSRFNAAGNEVLQACFIFPSIHMILLEKQLEFSDKIKIEVKISDEFYIAYSRLNETTLSRIISNIINNAFEAIHGDGEITIELSTNADWHRLIIKDNGCGIPAEAQEKIFDYGYSHGKKQGSGIGLAYSKAKINSWGGEIEVNSQVNAGTEVTIKLPMVTPGSGLVSSINLIEDAVMVVVDDDRSIHEAWDSHFKQMARQKNASVKIIHLYSPDEFESWYLERDQEKDYHFLIDYDFNANLNGVNLIEKFNIHEQTYLVTSKYYDLEVNHICQDKKILLIPKDLLQYLEVQFCSRDPDLILIDDDLSLIKAWKYKASLKDKNIVCFKNIAEFNLIKQYFSLLTPIYIDSNLKLQKRGEKYAKNIYTFGFHEIYLCTGMSASFITKPNWIRAIVSKNPPF